MERTRAGEGTSERSQREELEDAQMQLRRARAELATAGAEGEATRKALAVAIEQAQAQRTELEGRLRAATDERSTLQQELVRLAERLEKKREEDEVLARGAKLRDVEVPWYHQGKPVDPRAVERWDVVTSYLIGLVLLGVVLSWLVRLG